MSIDETVHTSSAMLDVQVASSRRPFTAVLYRVNALSWGSSSSSSFGFTFTFCKQFTKSNMKTKRDRNVFFCWATAFTAWNLRLKAFEVLASYLALVWSGAEDMRPCSGLTAWSQQVSEWNIYNTIENNKHYSPWEQSTNNKSANNNTGAHVLVYIACLTKFSRHE